MNLGGDCLKLCDYRRNLSIRNGYPTMTVAIGKCTTFLVDRDRSVFTHPAVPFL